MKKIFEKIKVIINSYTGNCPNCGGYYLDNEDVCQICGWPYNH